MYIFYNGELWFVNFEYCWESMVVLKSQGWHIEYLLLFLIRLDAFVCSLFFHACCFCVLTSSFVLVLSCTCYLLIMHVSNNLDKNYFMLHFHKR